MMTEVGAAYFDDARRRHCATTCSRAAFCGRTISGVSTRGLLGEADSEGVAVGPFPIVDLPLDHPLFHQMMNVHRIPQIPSIGFWDGGNWPHPNAAPTAPTPHARAIIDDHGPHHGADDAQHRFRRRLRTRRRQPRILQQFSVPGYAFGVNTLLYAMTH